MILDILGTLIDIGKIEILAIDQFVMRKDYTNPVDLSHYFNLQSGVMEYLIIIDDFKFSKFFLESEIKSFLKNNINTDFSISLKRHYFNVLLAIIQETVSGKSFKKSFRQYFLDKRIIK